MSRVATFISHLSQIFWNARLSIYTAPGASPCAFMGKASFLKPLEPLLLTSVPLLRLLRVLSPHRVEGLGPCSG